MKNTTGYIMKNMKTQINLTIVNNLISRYILTNSIKFGLESKIWLQSNIIKLDKIQIHPILLSCQCC